MAATFADRVLRATDRLAEFPRMGRVLPELNTPNIREILVGSYRIVYRIKNEQAQLLAIRHGARLLDAAILDS